jgi:hypothetical protein
LPRPAGLLCAAALALVLAVSPAAAGASPQSHALKQAQHAQRKAARLQQREERRAAHQQRKADRQAKQATRHEEREEQRTTRAKEREQRTSARSETTTGPTTGEAPAPTDTKEGPAASPETPVVSRHDCTITVAASAPLLKSGETATLTGKLSCPGDEEGEAGEREVTVYQREARSGGSDPAVAGTVKTAADGTYEFQSAALNGRSTFLVRYAGARHQARVVVQVSSGVSLQGPQPAGAALAMGANAAAGGAAKATFSGAIEPAEAGRQVALRVRYEGGEWRTVAFTRTGPEGQFSFTHKFRFAGAVEIVALAHARGTERTQSQMLAYSIVQAQNPALTIASAPAPVAPVAPLSAGDTPPASGAAQTTISGVAAGAPHQTVTLLASTPNGAFAPVATVESDDTGAYTFTVAPTQTTLYKVRCGKTRSTLVRVVVPTTPPAAPTS